MAPLKIGFFSYASGMGGAEHSLLGLLSRLPAEKFDPRVYHTEMGPFPEAVDRLGIATTHLPFGFDPSIFERSQLLKALLFHPFAPFQMFRWVRNFGRILAKDRIDSIHANQPKSHLLAMLIPGSMPYVLHLRDIFDSRSIPWFLYRLLFAQRRGNAVAISQAVANSFPANLRVKTKVIHNGTCLPDLPNTNRQRAVEVSSPYICAVGRLVPWKGFDLLFRAFRETAAQFPAVQLRVFGEVLFWDGDYKSRLERQIREYRLENRIHLEGYRDDLSKVFLDSRFLVLPSIDEPFGRVLIEAMAHARPVIAFRTGGIPEIVTHMEEGILVDERDATPLSQAMEWMLGHESEAEAMGRKGRATVEARFSLDRHAREMTKLFDSILRPGDNDDK